MKKVITMVVCEAELTTYNDEGQVATRKMGKLVVAEADIPEAVRDWLWSQVKEG